MDKLSRLEHIIKRLASENTSDAETAAAGHAEKDADHMPWSQSPPGPGTEDKQPSKSPAEVSQVSSENQSSLDFQFGRLVINDSKSYYVGNVLWANLANEVGVI